MLVHTRHHRGIRRCFAALPIAFAVGAASCADNSPFEPDTIRIGVNVARQSVAAGDTVTITVSTAKLGSRDVSYLPNHCFPMFEVLKDDRVVISAIESCAATILLAPAPVILRSSEIQTTRYVWTATYINYPALLSPGSYEIRGTAIVNGVEVKGQRVPITVTQ
jgi:hypothetical protein